MKTLALICWFVVWNLSAVAQPASPLSSQPLRWSDDELGFFARSVGESPLIGLGESVHATEGYSEAKFRLIRYLIEKRGFRNIAWETPWRNAVLVDQYVRGQAVSKEAAIRSIFAVWRSQAVLDLFTWVRDYNRAHPQTMVRFYGFDGQHQQFQDLKSLSELVSKLPLTIRASIESQLPHCFGWGRSQEESNRLVFGDQPATSEAESAQCRNGIQRIKQAIASQPAVYPPSERRLVRISVAGVELSEAYALYYSKSLTKVFERRDLSMAQIFREMNAAPEFSGKTVIWAHNTHLALDYTKVDDANYPHVRNFGSWLKRLYGAKYFPIALVGYVVKVNWPGQAPMELKVDNLTEELAGVLHAKFGQNTLVDLSPAVNSVFPVSRIFTLGGAHLYPAEQFRGILHLETVSGMIAPRF